MLQLNIFYPIQALTRFYYGRCPRKINKRVSTGQITINISTPDTNVKVTHTHTLTVKHLRQLRNTFCSVDRLAACARGQWLGPWRRTASHSVYCNGYLRLGVSDMLGAFSLS